jgi:hypothetical protein
MIIDIPLTRAVEQQFATASLPDPTVNFNWRRCWYPIAFVRDLPKEHPYSFSLYDEPLVLFRDREGKLACLSDRCCHRPAKLSDGRVVNDKIEYRKWLDKVVASLPFYDGYSTSKGNSIALPDRRHLQDRLSRHTSICQDCHHAYRNSIALKQTLIVMAIGFAGLAIAIDGTSIYKLPSISASLLATALGAIVRHVEVKFERSYERS